MPRMILLLICVIPIFFWTSANAQSASSACQFFSQTGNSRAFIECMNQLYFSSAKSKNELNQLRKRVEKLETSLRAALRETVPSGAVMAFDLADGCPAGWEAHSRSAGRVIIGEGVGIGNNSSDALLSERRYPEIGGTETHSLTADELPPHQHNVPFIPEVSDLSGNGFPVMSDQRHSSDLRAGTATSVAGKGIPHNNMPPYVVLYYCKKT